MEERQRNANPTPRILARGSRIREVGLIGAVRLETTRNLFVTFLLPVKANLHERSGKEV